MSLLSVLHDEAHIIANALRQQVQRMEAALGHIPDELHAILEKIEGHKEATAPVVEPKTVVETPVVEETHSEQK
jgi:hypothetical protein